MMNAGQNASIIHGHGNQGVQATGIGNDPNRLGETDKILAWYNESEWKPYAQSPGYILLLGCRVGAGWEGSELLYRVARATGNYVGAVTGDVFCGNGTWHNDGVEQTARPDYRPPPIDPPSRPSYESLVKTDYILLTDDVGGLSPVNLSDVRELRFLKRGNEGQDFRLTLRNEDASHLARAANLSGPIRRCGSPAAFNTGIVELSYVNQRRLMKKEFVAYNNIILQDGDYPEWYYFPTDPFIQLMENI